MLVPLQEQQPSFLTSRSHCCQPFGGSSHHLSSHLTVAFLKHYIFHWSVCSLERTRWREIRVFMKKAINRVLLCITKHQFVLPYPFCNTYWQMSVASQNKGEIITGLRHQCRLPFLQGTPFCIRGYLPGYFEFCTALHLTRQFCTICTNFVPVPGYGVLQKISYPTAERTRPSSLTEHITFVDLDSENKSRILPLHLDLNI